MAENIKRYNTIIIGGGVSGTALFYTLANYSNLHSIAIIEKYSDFGQVNSKGKNNSQTLHVGDIETNYSFKKAQLVKPAALMIPNFVKKLDISIQEKILFKVHKMILAVGEREVKKLNERFYQFKKLYPDLKKIERNEIEKIEPIIVKNRNKNIKILALFSKNGYAVDYEKLAQAFVSEVKKSIHKSVKKTDIFLNTQVLKIEKIDFGYCIVTNKCVLEAETVVVNTDAHSLMFAKSLGYGKEFSLIPVAGSFYFSKKVLNGKVYTMQDTKLPFAAVHGDPDIQVSNVTRWGPTAKMIPVLETGKMKTIMSYFKSAGLFRIQTVISFIKILSDWTRFKFLIKNTFYDIPILGKYLFVHNIQKIAPSLNARDIKRARGFGGMRLQRVDVNKKELQLGEGKIIGDNIIFNMTPSPGASVCLFNGMRDAENLIDFFNGKYSFRKCDMENDFGGTCFDHDDISISENTYVS